MQRGTRVTCDFLQGEWEVATDVRQDLTLFGEPAVGLSRGIPSGEYAFVPARCVTPIAPVPPEPPIGSVGFVGDVMRERLDQGWAHLTRSQADRDPDGRLWAQWKDIHQDYTPAVPLRRVLEAIDHVESLAMFSEHPSDYWKGARDANRTVIEYIRSTIREWLR